MNTNDQKGRQTVDRTTGNDTITVTNHGIRILTIQEVAKLLRVHRSTISRYAKSGELKSYMLGARRLFRSDDVWAFFENQVTPEYASKKEA